MSKNTQGIAVSHGTEEKPTLTREELAELLSYDPKTGVFRWRKNRPGGVKAGDEAGARFNSYRWISIKGTKYLAHRLAFLFMTGKWPAKYVDHIDGEGLNNAWSNLREATPTENAQNIKKANKNSETGLLGVSTASRGRGFQAQIRVNGESHHLGYFDNELVAAAVYDAAKRILHKYWVKN